MSVTTTADEKRDQAKQCVLDAAKALDEMIDPSTWGSDEFKKEYLIEMTKIAYELKLIYRRM